MYTLENIHTSPSYALLKRNNFTDAEAVNYYMLEPKQRTPYFNTIKNSGITVAPTLPSTQKCTSFIERVKKMALELMDKDFIYKGVVYNMNALRYTFSFNSVKSSWGRHNGFKRRIQLSEWMIKNHEDNMDFWVDTMLHEIAHAIDYEIKGYRPSKPHGLSWQVIAKSIGCNGERTGHLNAKSNKASKYTIKCTNCNRETHSHRRNRNIELGRVSCGKCGKGHFDRNKLLVQIQNY